VVHAAGYFPLVDDVVRIGTLAKIVLERLTDFPKVVPETGTAAPFG
jgi:hypothetical protein